MEVVASPHHLFPIPMVTRQTEQTICNTISTFSGLAIIHVQQTPAYRVPYRVTQQARVQLCGLHRLTPTDATVVSHSSLLLFTTR